MSRLPRLLFMAALTLASISPAAYAAQGHNQNQIRNPDNDTPASFDGYYGYDGKYHYPAGYGRSAASLGAGWRPSGYTYGSGYGSGHHHGR